MSERGVASHGTAVSVAAPEAAVRIAAGAEIVTAGDAADTGDAADAVSVHTAVAGVVGRRARWTYWKTQHQS